MTNLEKPVTRRTIGSLGGQFGADSGKQLVVTLERGDVIAIKPLRASAARTEYVSLFDIYGMALRARANREYLAKARAKKAALAEAKLQKEINRKLGRKR